MNTQSILVVEDDEGFRDSLKDILEEHGYEVLCAGTCSEALTFARDSNPAAALLDIRLPDGSGTTLLGNLKELNSDCICTIMTAFADMESVLQALERGAFHYLQKPIKPRELLNLLEKIFDTIRLRREKDEAEKDLKQSESTVRTLLDAFPFVAMLVDLTGRIIAANRFVADILQKNTYELVGTNTADLNSKEVHENRKLKTMEAIQTSQAVRFEEKENGRIMDTVISPVFNDSKEPSCLAIFSRDITEARQAEEEKKKLEASFAHAQRMEAVGTLAGGIAHDFNNLLQGILGYTEILLMDKESKDTEYTMLTNVKQAARRASELTRQLLTFSRKTDSELKPLNLNDTLKQTEELLRRTIPKMINIKFRFEEKLNYITADPTQLEQILMNLVVNARDAMPDGGKIVIETENIFLDEKFCKTVPECVPGNYVLLKVSDTGKGMDEEIIGRIFEPFFTTKEPGKGTGLGLAMVFGIVKSYRGHIVCESKPDFGTSFRIYLPVVQQEINMTLEDAEVGDDATPSGSETILLVEDEETLRSLARHLLTRFGYNVLIAENGENALALFKKHRSKISLVLLDLIMPGMGGKRCMEELLKKNPKLKIIIASGYSGEDSVTQLLENGAKGFVTKPYNIKDVLKIIRKVLDSKP